MFKEKQLTEIKVKVTNTSSDEVIENIDVFAPTGTAEGIKITSLNQGISYESILGALAELPTTKFIIEMVGVGDTKETAYTPFRLHTLSLSKGDYSGKGFAPAMSGDTKDAWLSPKPVKWGGKGKYTKMILQELPANSSVIIILKPYEEKEVLTPPDSADNYLLNTETVCREKVTLMKVGEAVEKLKALKPRDIFSLNYSNEKPFIKVENYDDDGLGVIISCAAWGKDKPASYYLYEDLYKLLKKEGLKSIVF